MKIIKVRDVKTPQRGTSGSACYDFFIPNDTEWETRTIAPGDHLFVPSGVKARVPEGFMLQALNKSGVALKKGLVVGAQVVDSDYTGEVHLHLINASSKSVTVSRGEKILQFALVPISLQGVDVLASELELFGDLVTERGAGGFGSTGV